MNMKSLLRKMRLPRELYYKHQFQTQLKKLPADMWSKNISELKALKGRYTGKRCFIIGNGPSLTVQDLDRLKGEYCFASNRIFTIYPKTEWRPTFFAIQDDVVLEGILENLSDTLTESELGFISANNYGRSCEHVKSNANVLWFPKRYSPPKKNLYRFSDNVSKELFEGLTITYSCIQIAVHMGFSEIYLLGVDHNYPLEFDADGNVVKNDSSVQAYFGEASVSANQINFPKVIEMTRAYISAEKHSRKNGYRIYNATRGGKLEAFERANFDELFH